MACEEYYGVDNNYHIGKPLYTLDGTTYYDACACTGYPDGTYGFLYNTLDKSTAWMECTKPMSAIIGNIPPMLITGGMVLAAGAVAFLFIFFILESIFPVKKALPSSFGSIPIRKFSNIDLRRFVEHRAIPRVPAGIPDVDETRWHFDKFGDDGRHTVSLRLVLSEADQNTVNRWGLDEDPIEEEPLFDEEATNEVLAAQEQEMRNAGNDTDKIAGLRVEHEQQLAWMEKQTWSRRLLSITNNGRMCASFPHAETRAGTMKS